jgi:biopolymer transport protein ExbD
MARANIRSRRGRHKLSKDFGLQLTSLLDILVIILVFLLKSYSTSMSTYQDIGGLKMPLSISSTVAEEAIHLVMTPDELLIENEKLVDLERLERGGKELSRFKRRDLDRRGQIVPKLYDALIKAKEKTSLLFQKSDARDDKGKPLPFHGVIAIQADESIPYDAIRRVLFTAGAADYRIFRFLARQKEGQ